MFNGIKRSHKVESEETSGKAIVSCMVDRIKEVSVE